MRAFAFPIESSPVSTQCCIGNSSALCSKIVCGVGVDLMVDLTKV